MTNGDARDLARSLRIFSEQCHKDMIVNGFYDNEENKNIPTKICLIHSEASELLEAFRHGWDEHSEKEIYLPTTADMNPRRMTKKEEEFADILLRLVDFAAFVGIDLGQAALAKAHYNRTRPHKHGNKKV